MNKNSTIFERVLILIEAKGIKNVAELADIMGYASPQKIYRLKRDHCKPSFDILEDFSNKFDDLNIRWFITGKGSAFTSSLLSKDGAYQNIALEPSIPYTSPDEIQQLKEQINNLEIEKKSLLLALREIGSGQAEAKK